MRTKGEAGSGNIVEAVRHMRALTSGIKRLTTLGDDELMAAALESTGLKTKKAVIEKALRTLVQMKAQEKTRALRGKLHWEGNLAYCERDGL